MGISVSPKIIITGLVDCILDDVSKEGIENTAMLELLINRKSSLFIKILSPAEIYKYVCQENDDQSLSDISEYIKGNIEDAKINDIMEVMANYIVKHKTLIGILDRINENNKDIRKPIYNINVLNNSWVTCADCNRTYSYYLEDNLTNKDTKASVNICHSCKDSYKRCIKCNIYFKPNDKTVKKCSSCF